METTRYAYYPGCTSLTSAKEYDATTRLVCQKLGVELSELKDWTCCGASSAHSSDEILATALPARELQKAAKQGLPVVATCALCFSRLKLAAHELQDEKTRTMISGVIGEDIPKNPNYRVLHILQVLIENMGKIKVEKPLKGLKVASYYGCLLSRPKDITKFDDVENPRIMDDIVTALGADKVEWAFKTECCGGSQLFARADVVVKLSDRLISQARQAGADCIAVACPMCQLNLDTTQKGKSSKQKDGAGIPVPYITQLIGLAAGVPVDQLMFDKLFTDPIPALKGKGLV
jgi:heterodisulfide reductase subunit B